MSKKVYLIWKYGLIFLAGASNACAILIFNSTISHYTGNLSLLAINYAQGEFYIINSLILNLCMFVIGSIISGRFFYDLDGKLQEYHLLLPSIFGGSIIFVYFIFPINYSLHLMALQMGVLNGIYLRSDQGVVRIPHMSGYLTDIGVAIGRLSDHKDKVVFKKLTISICSILMFCLGCLMATYLYYIFKDNLIYLLGGNYIGLTVTVVLINALDDINIKATD
jgi:uncharacterized membrane protein YoaK (UPF0700 family)